MSIMTHPITELIKQRYSSRAYVKAPIAPEQAGSLASCAAAVRAGPLGTPLRFTLVAAAAGDSRTLRGLGTYGLIKNPAGFLIGAVGPGERNLEDFGYGMEAIILHATDLGLGTCWLGGNFTKSSFARRISAAAAEIVPAVAAVGYAAENNRARDRLRRMARSDTRLPWDALFFRDGFATPLAESTAGPYATPLAMVRLAPSASNRQPWRVVRDGSAYHFYLQRTPGYGRGAPIHAVGPGRPATRGHRDCHVPLRVDRQRAWPCGGVDGAPAVLADARRHGRIRRDLGRPGRCRRRNNGAVALTESCPFKGECRYLENPA